MKRAFLIVIMAFGLALASNGQAAVINVPADMTLQTALNTAASNLEHDTINIAPGTYDTAGGPFSYTPPPAPEENYSLTIVGAGTGNTILDGGLSDQVMNIDTTGLTDDSNAHITVTGITFQNGYHGTLGGGLFILADQANVTVQDCEFSGNTAYDGGGVYANCNAGPVTLTNNTFS